MERIHVPGRRLRDLRAIPTHPGAPSEEDADSRGYGINYGNRTMVVFGASPYSMWGDLSPAEKLQRLEELEVKGTAGKLVSKK